jgi:TPR repeat protein
VERDQVEATKWFRKAAEQGLAEAQYELATSLTNGRGATKDPFEAFKWYLEAAKQGHTLAQVDLAWSYGAGDGVQRNPAAAYFWFSLALENQPPDDLREYLISQQDILRPVLTEAQIEEAERMVRDWKPTATEVD